jgi:hypothetical protein
MKVRDLVPDSWSGEPLVLGKLYDAGETARVIHSTKVTPKTVIVSTKNAIVGKRTIMSK